MLGVFWRPGCLEAYQVDQGICSTLLNLANSSLWPPTLRDMAAGQLQFLLVRICPWLQAPAKQLYSAGPLKSLAALPAVAAAGDTRQPVSPWQ